MLPKIETILYCTGMGPNAPHVFRHAVGMAKRFDARIIALHVAETLTKRQKALVEGYSGLGSLSEIMKQAHQEAVERLPKRIAEVFARLAPGEDWRQTVTEVITAEGHVAEEILRHVTSKNADLVVIGVHGESSFTLGSTARRLIKDCPVPVLAVQVPEGATDLSLIDP